MCFQAKIVFTGITASNRRYKLFYHQGRDRSTMGLRLLSKDMLLRSLKKLMTYVLIAVNNIKKTMLYKIVSMFLNKILGSIN